MESRGPDDAGRAWTRAERRSCGSGAEEGEGEGRREEKEKEKRKWKRKGKKEKKREREKREREIRAALIAASTAGPVGCAQRSRARADEATGKKGGSGGVGDRMFGTEKDFGN